MFIKTSRENWLRISESLRRFDLALEQNRRDSGELIQRSEVEKVLQRFGWCLRVAAEEQISQAATALAGEPDVGPSSVAAWAAARAFREGASIDEVARMLGIRSLDRAARFIGWDWKQEH